MFSKANAASDFGAEDEVGLVKSCSSSTKEEI